MNLDEAIACIQKYARNREEVMNDPMVYEKMGDAYKTAYNYQPYGFSIGAAAQQRQDMMNANIGSWLYLHPEALAMFPYAEPQTAQKQYSRLLAAKAWLKGRGK